MMFFDQHIGPFVKIAAFFGWHMQVGVNYFDTAFAMVFVSVWKQIPYNFIFFLSGLQSVPVSVREAAYLDCRSGVRRFWTVIMPLLAPTAFFLLIINVTYACSTPSRDRRDGEGQGGQQPDHPVYKVFLDGFAATISAVLGAVRHPDGRRFRVTVLQFRFLEKRIHYG